MLFSQCCVLLLILVLAYVSLIDCRTKRIPDELNIAIGVGGIMHGYANSNITSGFVCALLIMATISFMFLLFKKLKNGKLLGGGDIKMLAASAFWLDPSCIPMFLVTVGTVGIISGILSKSKAFPLAPAISIGLLLTLSVMNLHSADHFFKSPVGVFVNNPDLGSLCASAHAAVPKQKHAKNANITGIKTDKTYNSKKGNNMTPADKEKPFSCMYIKAKKQPAKKIIILMHGYGADADNVMPIAEEIASALDNTDIFVPDGFDPCEENPSGRQWFSFEGWGNPEDWKQGISIAAGKLNKHIDLLLKKYGLDNSKLYLAGFSQGAMMALHVGLQRKVAGIVSFSGMLVDDTVLKDGKIKTPVMLAHGDEDSVVPVSFCIKAEDYLKKANVPVKVIIARGMGHAVSNAAIRSACDFLKQQ